MAKLKIKSNGVGVGTTVEMDGRKVEGLRAVDFYVNATGTTRVCLMFDSIDVDIDTENGQIMTELEGRLYELKPV